MKKDELLVRYFSECPLHLLQLFHLHESQKLKILILNGEKKSRAIALCGRIYLFQT